MNVIELENLDFSYNRKDDLLRNINMQVPRGSIYGFLGPNGAGKTTTLKLILNLLKNRSKGTIRIFDKDVSSHYPSYLGHIGSLIEDASIYDHLSAQQNLKLWKNYYHLTSNRVEEVLDIIGLSDTAGKKVKNYSTGMKQRLGLGIAMIHDPDILILDEPTNGLDPMGISELRKLLRNLRDLGKTILLSSHILSEVEKVCDHIGVIKSGQMMFEGSLSELKKMTMQDLNIKVVVDKIDQAKQILEQHFPTLLEDNHLSISISSTKEVNKIAQLIIEQDVQLHEIVQPKINLETIFMKLAN